MTTSGAPTIFNTDQGCQFTSLEFTDLLTAHGIHLSMVGTGCWRDNVFVERLWFLRSSDRCGLVWRENVR